MSLSFPMTPCRCRNWMYPWVAINCQWPRPYLCIKSLPWRVSLPLSSGDIVLLAAAPPPPPGGPKPPAPILANMDPAQTDSLLSAVANRMRQPLGQEAHAAARAGTGLAPPLEAMPPLRAALIRE